MARGLILLFIITNMWQLLHYSFVIRGLEAGLIVALIAPLIGMFLVLRRYSLIADTLSHVSLAGVAIGLLLGVNPIVTAIVTSVGASAIMEKLRTSRQLYGESALSIFLSGSLALAIILISSGKGLGVNVMNYLFGSIVTVGQSDVMLMSVIAVVVALVVGLVYQQLIFITFDEESARVAGLKVDRLNTLLITMVALTVAVAIPIIGVLLISALVVIPVVAALQFKKSFNQTLVLAELISVFSVVVGIILSFYLNLSSGGTIVLLALAILGLILVFRR